MNAKESFVHFLVEAGALKFGNFVTKSGRETPYFINTGEFRTGATLSKLAEYYASAFMEHFDGKAQNLYGPAYKGIPLCAATAMKLSDVYAQNLTFTYNRKEVKDHGEGGSLVGYKYAEKTNVVIIEDVITAGTSVNETMQATARKSSTTASPHSRRCRTNTESKPTPSSTSTTSLPSSKTKRTARPWVPRKVSSKRCTPTAKSGAPSIR